MKVQWSIQLLKIINCNLAEASYCIRLRKTCSRPLVYTTWLCDWQWPFYLDIKVCMGRLLSQIAFELLQHIFSDDLLRIVVRFHETFRRQFDDATPCIARRICHIADTPSQWMGVGARNNFDSNIFDTLIGPPNSTNAHNKIVLSLYKLHSSVRLSRLFCFSFTFVIFYVWCVLFIRLRVVVCIWLLNCSLSLYLVFKLNMCIVWYTLLNILLKITYIGYSLFWRH